MPQTVNYIQSGALTVLVSGEIDSLANNSLRLAGVDYNNASGYPMAEVEFTGGAPASYTASTGISVWFLRGLTSGTYEDGASGFTPARAPNVVFPLVSGAQRVARQCQIPPQTFRVLVKNDGTGVSLASSGNLVRLLPLSFQVSSGG